MKTFVTALLLSAAVPGLCQEKAQEPVNPDQTFQMPNGWQQGGRDFSKLPAFKGPLNVMPLPRVVIPRQAPKVGDPQIDSQLVRRPPKGSFAQQQPRTPLAARLYPDLQLLPVDTARLDVPSTQQAESPR